MAQLRQRAIKLASPCPLLNSSCTVLHMLRNTHPLALLSTWIVVPTASRYLLLIIIHVPLERRMWLLMKPTLPVASQLLTGLQPLSEVGDFNTSGTGARASEVDDGLFPGLEGRDNSASTSSYLHILPDDHVKPLLSFHNATPDGSGGGEDFDQWVKQTYYLIIN